MIALLVPSLVPSLTQQASAAPFVDALAVDVGNHSVALPLGQLARITPFYPALSVGAEHAFVDHGAFGLVQTGRVGAFHHGVFGTSVTLGTELLARITTGVGPCFEGGLSLGAIDSWRARPVLAWSEESGTYAPASDPGRLGLTAGFTLGVGMDLGRVSRVPLAPMLVYRWFVQSPFLPSLPLGPQGTLGLGVRWTPGGAS